MMSGRQAQRTQSPARGLRVLDIGDVSGQMAARILGDLGASVLAVRGLNADQYVCGGVAVIAGAEAGEDVHAKYWDSGKRVVPLGGLSADDWAFISACDIAIGTPSSFEAFGERLSDAAIRVVVTPFGSTGPRAHWKGSELTAFAASGNLFVTGDPDRQPVDSAVPIAPAHAGGEIAVAALFGLAAGAREVDVSIQESVQSANMTAPAVFLSHGIRGQRVGTRTGRTPEIWPCSDGHVTFGVRGGPSRASSWVGLRQLMKAEGRDVSMLPQGDARAFNHMHSTEEELEHVCAAIGAYFRSKTRDQLYALSIEHKLLIAQVLDASGILSHPQLKHREFFGPQGIPTSPVRVLDGVDEESLDYQAGGLELKQPWSDLNILELGSAFAGPLVGKYFVEYGATCVRIESRRQPDSMRLFGIYPLSEGLPEMEGSPTFAGLNVGKKSAALNLSTAEGLALARRLACEWADVVIDNYVPGILARWGLDHDSLKSERPDLVHVSTSLWGADGPNSNERGYGSQGQALSGHLYLTGWPDRDPVGAFGMISDSVSPRLAAAALAAALLRRRQTNLGCRIDVSQVESTAYMFGAWLLEQQANGVSRSRRGNAVEGLAVHDAFPCLGHERWIAIVADSRHELSTLEELMRIHPRASGDLDKVAGHYPDPRSSTIATWTSGWDVTELAELLQAHDIDAYPVLDHGDLFDDPQLTQRQHFVAYEHHALGRTVAERSGFRITGVEPEEVRSSPAFGQHTHETLSLLGIEASDLPTLDSETLY